MASLHLWRVIPKSGNRFSDKITRKAKRNLARDPEKWERFSDKITRKAKLSAGRRYDKKVIRL
jgi:hypothetical protein